MSLPQKTLAVVVPLFNEADSIELFLEAVIPLLNTIADRYNLLWYILAVDDGSEDATLHILRQWARHDSRIRVLALSRNFGKEAALTAGLAYARTNAVIVMDADMQDPPSLMDEMVRRWLNGANMVVGIRSARESDTKSKRYTSNLYYKLYNTMSQRPIPVNAGDFRLMDKSVVDAVLRLRERNRFMKGIFSWVGFKTEYIYFARPQRHCGATKWNYWKLFNFGLDGLTSFSTLPLRVWTYIGFLISFFAFLCSISVIFRTLFFGEEVKGFPTLIVAILFLGGLQLFSLGILGEYIGRLYQESKKRPLYIIKEKININK